MPNLMGDSMMDSLLQFAVQYKVRVCLRQWQCVVWGSVFAVQYKVCLLVLHLAEMGLERLILECACRTA